MRRLNLLYTKYFNIKYGLLGHLFQGRYHAEPIGNDVYLLEASKYIHLNPVRAKITQKPSEYEWSSYTMLTGEKKEKLINPDRILSYFPCDNRRMLYKAYVENF